MSSKRRNNNSSDRNISALGALFMVVICFMIASSVSSSLRRGSQERASRETIDVTVLASPEGQAVLTDLVNRFNKSKPQVDGRPVEASIRFLESGEMLDAVLSGQEQPVAISPASSTWLTQINADWRAQTGSETPLATAPQQLFVSPIVIGMWDNMARAMGYPERALGWREIIKATLDAKGWGAFGHPEWGAFRFAHASPDTDSGRLAMLAEFYAGAGKVRGLSRGGPGERRRARLRAQH